MATNAADATAPMRSPETSGAVERRARRPPRGGAAEAFGALEAASDSIMKLSRRRGRQSGRSTGRDAVDSSEATIVAVFARRTSNSRPSLLFLWLISDARNRCKEPGGVFP